MISLRRNKKSVLFASVVTSVALAASVVPANAETGVSSSEIKLGITVPMTGIAAPGYNKVAPAMKAYFDYINANGGIYGRKINLIIKDDRYIPQEAINKTNELILKDKVFALVGQLGTANNLAIASKVRLGSRKIPSIGVLTGFSGFADKKKYPTTFMSFPSYAAEGRIIGTYINENLATKTVCLVSQNDDFGSDAAKGFTAAGVKFAEHVKYVSGTQSSATAQVWIGKLVAAKCEVVVLMTVSSATAPVLAVANAAGYKPQWILGSVGSDTTTLKLSLAPAGIPAAQAAALFNGAIGLSFAPDPSDTTDEYVKLFREVNANYNKGVEFDNNVAVGMNYALVVAQALRAAGTSPTRAKLIKAMETKGSTFASIGYSPMGWTATSHAGHSAFWFGKFNLAGELKPLDAARTLYTTDNNATQPVTKTTAKRVALPAKGIPTNS